MVRIGPLITKLNFYLDCSGVDLIRFGKTYSSAISYNDGCFIPISCIILLRYFFVHSTLWEKFETKFMSILGEMYLHNTNNYVYI